MAMRGDWQFREVSICIRHKHPLVPLWTEGQPTRRFDIGERLSEIRGAILNGDLDKDYLEPSAFDYWLDQRLENGQDQTWLASQTLFAATTFCRLLGFELLRINDETGSLGEFDQMRRAQAIGFNVSSKGADAIRSSLHELASVASGYNDEPRKAFGSIYSSLSRAYVSEESFADFRDLLREFILNNWAVASGEVLLGKPTKMRRLHSLRSASLETGIGQALLGQFLEEAGAFQENDNRPDARKTFNSKEFQDLLDEIPNLVGPNEMRVAIGATKMEFKSLVDAQILVPRTKVPTIKYPWRLSDGIALLSELNTLASPISASEKGWEKIQLAQKRTRVSVAELISAIRQRKISLGQRVGEAGYQAFVVKKKEVVHLAQIRELFAESNLVPAAAFGRKIGIRDGGDFLRFLSSGHSQSTPGKHRMTGARMTFMNEEDMKKFHERFVTLTSLSSETGEHRNTIIAKLEASNVKRFMPDGEDFGSIYLRSDVMAAGYGKPEKT